MMMHIRGSADKLISRVVRVQPLHAAEVALRLTQLGLARRHFSSSALAPDLSSDKPSFVSAGPVPLSPSRRTPELSPSPSSSSALPPAAAAAPVSSPAAASAMSASLVSTPAATIPSTRVGPSSLARACAGNTATPHSDGGGALAANPTWRPPADWSFYRRELPLDLVSFNSSDGRRLFREALVDGTMESYFPLSEQFLTQSEPSYCAISSLTMCLNALGVDPGRNWKLPWRWFTEEMLECCTPMSTIRDEGMTFRQFSSLARCHGVLAQDFRADLTSIEHFRALLLEVSTSSSAVAPGFASAPHGDPARGGLKAALVVSFSRKTLGQTGDGHMSPLAGYHAASDSVLVLDVARFKYPSFWVSVPRLWEAMLPHDRLTDRPRGYCLLSPLPKSETVPRPLLKAGGVLPTTTVLPALTPAPAPALLAPAAQVPVATTATPAKVFLTPPESLPVPLSATTSVADSAAATLAAAAAAASPTAVSSADAEADAASVSAAAADAAAAVGVLTNRVLSSFSARVSSRLLPARLPASLSAAAAAASQSAAPLLEQARTAVEQSPLAAAVRRSPLAAAMTAMVTGRGAGPLSLPPLPSAPADAAAHAAAARADGATSGGKSGAGRCSFYTTGQCSHSHSHGSGHSHGGHAHGHEHSHTAPADAAAATTAACTSAGKAGKAGALCCPVARARAAAVATARFAFDAATFAVRDNRKRRRSKAAAAAAAAASNAAETGAAEPARTHAAPMNAAAAALAAFSSAPSPALAPTPVLPAAGSASALTQPFTDAPQPQSQPLQQQQQQQRVGLPAQLLADADGGADADGHGHGSRRRLSPQASCPPRIRTWVLYARTRAVAALAAGSRAGAAAGSAVGPGVTSRASAVPVGAGSGSGGLLAAAALAGVTADVSVSEAAASAAAAALSVGTGSDADARTGSVIDITDSSSSRSSVSGDVAEDGGEDEAEAAAAAAAELDLDLVDSLLDDDHAGGFLSDFD